MDRGDLCPDDIVVAIIADRIEQPDAKKGFILDGFPRTVHQAEALDRMLREKRLTLDGVVELKVDEAALIRRIESRIKETLARGAPLRKDDDPEVLKTRLEAYRRQTAPLIDYYREKGILRAVDGMAPIDEVTAAINWIFSKPSAKSASAQKTQPKAAKPTAPIKTVKVAAAKPKSGSRKAAKSVPKAKPAKKLATKPAARKAAGKPARKTAKKAAKRKAGRR
jgi:adenylate kinase